MAGRPKQYKDPVQKSITFEKETLQTAMQRFPDLSKKVNELVLGAIGAQDEEQLLASEIERAHKAKEEAQKLVQAADAQVQTLQAALTDKTTKNEALQALFADKLAIERDEAISIVQRNLGNPYEAKRLAGVWSTALKEKYRHAVTADDLLLLAAERSVKTSYIR